MSGPSSASEADFWSHLIKHDKTATIQLEQLCLGLCRIIYKFGPGPETNLTPQRLAGFYKSLGGNLDTLFLRSGDSSSTFNPSLSFIYRTLGCWHSLEPTPNPHETPRIPSLTPAGFVRWQTIQLLMFPDEHARYMQEAVRRYDVLQPNGRPFPKQIPRDAFPTNPDVEMHNWFEDIISQLQQEQTGRIRNSPYQSPDLRPYDHPDYFGSSLPAVRRQSRSSRERSSDEDRQRRLRVESRRSSEPFLSPPPGLSERKHQQLHSKDLRRRSQSAKRNDESSSSSSRPRSATADRPNSLRSASNQHVKHSRVRSNSERPFHQQTYGNGSDEESSGESGAPRRRHRKGESTLTSLIPGPFKVWQSRRRHSNDDGSRSPKAQRDESSRHREQGSRSARVTPPGGARTSPHVRFDTDIQRENRKSQSDGPRYELRSPPSARQSDTTRSSPYFPWSPQNQQPTSPSGHPMIRQQSGGSTGGENRTGSGSDLPLRVQTVVGVGGRKYANPEPQSAGSVPLPNFLTGSSPPGGVPGQDRQARFSMA